MTVWLAVAWAIGCLWLFAKLVGQDISNAIDRACDDATFGGYTDSTGAK